MFVNHGSQITHLCLAGKLVLKVPWKNLYTEPTIATLEGLYIVAVPNKGSALSLYISVFFSYLCNIDLGD